MSSNRIICLEPLVANQIAAGEVIERPASVVKELIENSVDANATKIDIEVEGGGIHLIRIRDNGHGIVKEDLPLAFCRHATSKIRTSHDLASITSLGFRGEALASIVSVSQCRMLSRAQEANEAWQIQILPDLQTHITPVSHGIGTTIEISELFYNTPVRRKFLRSEKTESLAMEDLIQRMALAFPRISISYRLNQKPIRHYKAVSDPLGREARVRKIVGDAFMEKTVPIALEWEGWQLTGWVALPTLLKRQADCQYFFVNQRVVRDRLLNHVIRTVYQEHPSYVEGTYPAYVLFLMIDPNEVDVNVHPTKQEVRFSRGVRLYDFIRQGTQQALCLKEEKRVFLQHIQPALAAIPRNKIEKTIMKEGTEKRYMVIEHPQGMQIIDVRRSKIDLLTYFLKKNRGAIAKTPLIFSEHYPLPLEGLGETHKFTILEEIGFEYRIENDQLIVLKQPFYVSNKVSVVGMQAIIVKVNETIDFRALATLLSPFCSENTLAMLQWSREDITPIPSVWLSHQDVENLFKVQMHVD